MTPGPLHLKFLRVVGALCFNFFPFHSLTFTLCHWTSALHFSEPVFGKAMLPKCSRHIKALVLLDFSVATEDPNPSSTVFSHLLPFIIGLVLCNFMTIYLDSNLLTRFLNTVSVVLKL